MKENLNFHCVECGKEMKNDDGVLFPYCGCLLDNMVKEITEEVDRNIIDGLTMDYFLERVAVGSEVPKEYIEFPERDEELMVIKKEHQELVKSQLGYIVDTIDNDFVPLHFEELIVFLDSLNKNLRGFLGELRDKSRED